MWHPSLSHTILLGVYVCVGNAELVTKTLPSVGKKIRRSTHARETTGPLEFVDNNMWRAVENELHKKQSEERDKKEAAATSKKERDRLRRQRNNLRAREEANRLQEEKRKTEEVRAAHAIRNAEQQRAASALARAEKKKAEQRLKQERVERLRLNKERRRVAAEQTLKAAQERKAHSSKTKPVAPVEALLCTTSETEITSTKPVTIAHSTKTKPVPVVQAFPSTVSETEITNTKPVTIAHAYPLDNSTPLGPPGGLPLPFIGSTTTPAPVIHSTTTPKPPESMESILFELGLQQYIPDFVAHGCTIAELPSCYGFSFLCLSLFATCKVAWHPLFATCGILSRAVFFLQLSLRFVWFVASGLLYPIFQGRCGPLSKLYVFCAKRYPHLPPPNLFTSSSSLS